MAKLAVGEKMLDFTATGAFGPEEALSSRRKRKDSNHISQILWMYIVSV